MSSGTVTRVVKFIRKGEKGDDGRSVLGVDVEYAKSESNTTAPTSGWQTDAPVWENGYYIWSRTRISYSEGDDEYTAAVCITGSQGETGNGVVNIVEEYYRSTSYISPVGGSWSTSRPTWANGYYIWTRSHIYLTDRDYYTTAICVTGSKGSNGTTYYTWIKYADNANGDGMSDDPVDSDGNFKEYIGFAYNKTTATESTDPKVYKWTKFKGTDGVDGIDGVDGVDGTTFYTWIKYADSLNSSGYPTTIYDTPTSSTKYIGIAVNRTTRTEGNDPTVYSWTKFRGDDGARGDVGPALRGPQAWSDLPANYHFYAGGIGEPYKDVVLYNDQYYSCVKSHYKGDNAPGSTEDINNGFWQLGDQVELVASKILLATYALVKNLGVEAIDMRDANGNVLFTAKDGNVTCKTGTFDGVTVKNATIESGKIAGFNISGNSLTNYPFTNDAAVVFRNDGKGCFAGIGGNVQPVSSGMRAVARFENEDATDQWGIGANIAMLLSAKNGGRNYAFTGSGNGLLNGWIDGFVFKKFTTSKANTIYDGYCSLDDANRFIIVNSYSGSGILLPKLTAVRRSLGINTTTNFCVQVTFIADLNNGQNFEIYGRNKKKDSNGNYPWNSDEIPLLTHWDNGNWDTVSMGAGDSITILLIYDSSRTQKISDYTTKYTARIINRQN